VISKLCTKINGKVLSEIKETIYLSKNRA